jgi:alanine racemase
MAEAGVRADWLRAGIMSYGGVPDYPEHDAAHWHLQPGMTLRSKLIATQQVLPGESVGYGSSFVAEQPLRIGVVACGYADGYPRHCPTGTPILVDGVRTRSIGRVSMDMLAVDLTPVPAAQLGSEVTLWGRGPHGSLLGIDEVARAAGTIGYELMCAVAPRVPVHVA